MHIVPIREMRVQIDEPWKDRRAAEIDEGGAGRNGDRRGHFLNAIARDAYHRGLERRAAPSVDEAGGLDHNRLRRARQREQESNQSNADTGGPASHSDLRPGV